MGAATIIAWGVVAAWYAFLIFGKEY